MTARKPPKDWEKIELEYRAGSKSVREIGRDHDTSEAAIRKKALELGWQRDLRVKIAQRVRKEMVRSAARTSAELRTDEEYEDASVAVQTQALTRIRGRVNLFATAFDRLLKAFDDVTGNKAELLALAKAARDAGDDFALSDVDLMRLRQAVSLAGGIDIAKEISIVLKNLVPLDRQAHGVIEGEDGKVDSYDERLRALETAG